MKTKGRQGAILPISTSLHPQPSKILAPSEEALPREIRIILVGFGVVAQSFARLLSIRQSELLRNYGVGAEVVGIADRGGAAVDIQGLDLQRMLMVKKQRGTVAEERETGRVNVSPLEVMENLEAEVVVETTPTNVETGEPGLAHIKSALRRGIHVITTNKGPLALAFPALTELAEHNKVCLRFSGTVGAGIPVLNFAKDCLLGDRIKSIRGVLNGTTNYILTEMSRKRITLMRSVEKAQKHGFAEADPSMDIDGIDTACKLVILANWIMNRKVALKDVDIQGIRNVTQQSLNEALERGFAIKLIGSTNGAPSVRPMEISRNEPLCVDGVLNAVAFVTESAGELTLTGKGAGGVETASAVLRDLLDVGRHLSA